MDVTYTKIFTETSIIVRGLQNEIEELGIATLIKDRPESARLAGFVAQQASVELYVLTKDVETVAPIVELYRQKINA